MSVTIDRAALERITKKLGGITNMQKSAAKPMEETLRLFRDELTTYPRKSPGAFSALAKPAQRRAYWAKVSSGEINHGPGGYVRQGARGLGGSWNIAPIQRTARGIIGKIGTNKPYAAYVHKQGAQQPFHRASKWLTDKTVIEKTQSARQRIWERWIQNILNGRAR